MGIHIKIFGDDTWHNVVKPALNAAEHDLIEAAETEASKLVAIAQQKYPALVTAFTIGFNDIANDPTTKGLAKMEKVVMDILPQVPALASELSDLKNLKDFLVQMGQTVFNDTVSTLESEAKDLIGKLVA